MMMKALPELQGNSRRKLGFFGGVGSENCDFFGGQKILILEGQKILGLGGEILFWGEKFDFFGWKNLIFGVRQL